MRQLAIDLPPHPAFGRADFLVSQCNAEALGWIERWPDWPSRSLVLHGPAGAGKTHLAHVWCTRSGGAVLDREALRQAEPTMLAGRGALAVDDAETADEQALLHLCNCLNEAGASLIVITRQPAAHWPVALPDLASRLRAMPSVAIAAPDDALLAALLVKHFSDRQLHVAADVVDFLVRRMERSFAAAGLLAERLDRMTLGTHRPVGLAAARRALAEGG